MSTAVTRVAVGIRRAGQGAGANTVSTPSCGTDGVESSTPGALLPACTLTHTCAVAEVATLSRTGKR